MLSPFLVVATQFPPPGRASESAHAEAGENNRLPQSRIAIGRDNPKDDRKSCDRNGHDDHLSHD